MEKSESNDDTGLADLLDEALKDFTDKPAQAPRTAATDDDLDDFLAPMDQAATQKAAENFKTMLENLAEVAEKEKETNNSNPSDTSDGTQFLSELLGIKSIMDEEGADSELRMLTETMLRGCFTKDMLYPMVTQFHKAISEYLTESSETITDEERTSLNAQRDVFRKLVEAYEAQSEPPTEEQTAAQNELWSQLRDLGEVPPALIQRFESQLPATAGFPNLPNLPNLPNGPDNCSLM